MLYDLGKIKLYIYFTKKKNDRKKVIQIHENLYQSKKDMVKFHKSIYINFHNLHNFIKSINS